MKNEKCRQKSNGPPHFRQIERKKENYRRTSPVKRNFRFFEDVSRRKKEFYIKS